MSKCFFYSLLPCALLLLSIEDAIAQYGNEWIDFGKQYYKVSVASDGAYRITHSDLLAAGFPIGSVDPRRIQLYHRGEEQAIFVQGQADAVFDPGDYIEFYGVRNDGTNDADLYSSPAQQPHPYYNLYSDTAAYFLTWDQGLSQGKRMSSFSEINVPPIPTEAFHFNENLQLHVNQYSTGNTVSGVLQYTHFDQGEGWTGTTICIGNSGCTGQQDFAITGLTGGVPAGGLPQLELLLVGRDALSHQAEIYVGPDAGTLRLLSAQSFNNYETSLIAQPLLWADISPGGQLVIRVKVLGVGGQRDRLSLSYLKIRSPQSFDMASATGKVFRLREEPSDKSYLEISNAPAGLSIWDITDRAEVKIIGTTPAGPNISAIIPNTSSERILYGKSSFSTPKIERISFRQINPAAHNYIIVSNKLLMQPALGYNDPVKSYGGYRASEAGGNYDTLVVTMDQLYNQFNYGEPSSVSIYRFMKYMVDNGDPEYLFLIGKGLNVSQGFFRKATIGPSDFRDLVPSAGMPGADMAFTAGLSGVTNVPAVPTGRITASTPAHVAAYLNKIKEAEELPFNVLWRKKVLHLSGGIQANELITFREYMDGFGEIAKGAYYGGAVSTIGKQEPNPVELINISDEVNEGLNFITFFGHSSPSTIDIDIGFASDPIMGYQNKGKYPSFLINGCNAGVFFSNGTVFGEDWVLAAEKGARNFIAHSSFGFSSTLRAYTQMFYEVGYGDSTFIRAGIGDIQKEVAKRYLELNAPTISNVTQTQQMVLLGDPAVKLFGALKPDYETNDNAIFLESFDGSPVTALTDSFAVKVLLRNFGSVNKDTLQAKITRTFNDNSVATYDSVFYPLKSLDTLAFKLFKEEGVAGFGNNKFLVELDFDDDIDELDETNNSGFVSLFIPLTGTKNLFPIDNGIVEETTVKLIWQNTDLLSEVRAYVLEIDTVDLFDSDYKIVELMDGKVLLDYNLQLLSQDSLTYYWRTKLADPQPGENEGWSTTSFSFINAGGEGWAQIHFPQFLSNTANGLVRDPLLRELQFEETSADISVTNFGSNHPSPAMTSFKINNAEYNLATQGQPCRSNTINFVAFDKTTLVPYAGIPFIFQDPRTCGREPQVINSFRLSELDLGGANDVLEYIDNVNPSDSVVIFSIGNANYSSWTAPVISKLEELGIGSAQLASLQDGEPAVIFGRKGAASGTAQVNKTVMVPANEQELTVLESITGKATSGVMTSSLIGPATSWDSFISFIRKNEAGDMHSFDIVGVDLDASEVVLFSDVNGSLDISTVDPATYPFLKVRYKVVDEINLSPTQLRQWIIKYTPAAEGILLFDGGREQVTVDEGESWTANYRYHNISNKSFADSLIVSFGTFNKSSRLSDLSSKKIAAPAPGDSTSFSFSVATTGKTGFNNVNVFVNPRIVPEQYYENNALELLDYLNVLQDRFIPVLDVTVDGRYIMNGDYVSENPDIRLKVWDESRYILKTDTSGIRIFLKYPCVGSSCQFEPIYFSRSDLSWSPASESSDFEVLFSPLNLTVGEYQLLVEAQDGSGNQAVEPYEVAFKVSNDGVVSFHNPYPNPSQGEVFFKFTSTGPSAPDQYRLQIMSMDGRLVYEYEIKQPLPIGQNQFIWNGASAEGVTIGNGLYLFRQIVIVGGQSFTKNGKLALVR